MATKAKGRGASSALAQEELLRLYQTMALIRAFDETHAASFSPTW